MSWRSRRPGAARPGGVVGVLDLPEEGTVARGFLEVAGWVSPVELVDRVEVTVADAPPVPARPFGVARPDVARHLHDAPSVLSGFWHLASLEGRSPGERLRVKVEAVGPQDRVTIGSRVVTLAAAPPPPCEAAADGWAAVLEARATIAGRARRHSSGLNLLVAVHDLGLGGAQLFLQDILEHLLGAPDVSCTVLAPADGTLRADLEAMGARVHPVGDVPVDAVAYEARVRELVHLVVAEGCDAALVNTLGAFMGADVALRCGLPTVFAVHEHVTLEEFWRLTRNDLVDDHVRRRARESLEKAAQVRFVARATLELHARSLSGPLAHLEPGVPLGAISQARSRLDREALRRSHGYGPDDLLVVCVGTVEERKGQGQAVLALGRLAADHPELRLACVGSDGRPYACAVSELVAALGLRDRVRLVEVCRDVAPWYAMADAFVLASDLESLPRVLLEAMAWGLPTVSTSVAGTPELIEDGVTGILCSPRDVAALTGGLNRLIAMGEPGRRALGERAAAAVSGRDAGAYARALEHYLRQLTAEAAGSAGDGGSPGSAGNGVREEAGAGTVPHPARW